MSVFDVELAIKVMREASLEPLAPYPGATKPWRCLCTACLNEVTPRYNNVQQRGTGCRHCGAARRGQARRLPAEQAVAIMQAAGLEPLDPYPGRGDVPWRSRCAGCGDEVSPRLVTVKMRGRSCRRCGIERRGLALRVPDAVATAIMRAAGLEPLDPYPGRNNARWRCRCRACDVVGWPRLATVRFGQGGCVPCGIIKRATSQATPEAEAISVMIAAGYEPLEPYPGRNTAPWRCLCGTCGQIVTTIYKVIRRGDGGCWECGQAQSGQKRRVPAEEAMAFMRSARFEPLEPYPGNRTPWRCRCMECRTVSTPTFGNVSRGRRCRGCATYGLDPNVPAHIYLVVHERHHAIKIGIMNEGSGRLVEHRRNGWSPLVVDELPFVVAVASGWQAESVERAVIRTWRERLGADIAVKPVDMPQGGFTETASLLLVDPDRTAAEIIAMVDALDSEG